jgi:hypothetical protein
MSETHAEEDVEVGLGQLEACPRLQRVCEEHQERRQLPVACKRAAVIKKVGKGGTTQGGTTQGGQHKG